MSPLKILKTVISSNSKTRRYPLMQTRSRMMLTVGQLKMSHLIAEKVRRPTKIRVTNKAKIRLVGMTLL